MSFRVDEIAASTLTQSNARTVEGNTGLNEPLLQFKVREEENEVSDEKVLAWAENQSGKTPKEATEDFKKDVMKMLKIADPDKAAEAKYYLNKLVTAMQELNGANRTKFKLNGNLKQINLLEKRIKEKICLMNDYATFITDSSGSNVSISEDTGSGQYKLCINNKLLEVPERNVRIGVEQTWDGPELMIEITD